MLYLHDPAVRNAAPQPKKSKAAAAAAEEEAEFAAAAAAAASSSSSSSSPAEGLQLVCKRCNYREPVLNCAVVTDIRKPGSDAYNVNLINKYTKHDPTLPVQRMRCANPKCTTAGEDVDAVVVRTNYERLEYKFICPVCDHVW